MRLCMPDPACGTYFWCPKVEASPGAITARMKARNLTVFVKYSGLTVCYLFLVLPRQQSYQFGNLWSPPSTLHSPLETADSAKGEMLSQAYPFWEVCVCACMHACSCPHQQPIMCVFVCTYALTSSLWLVELDSYSAWLVNVCLFLWGGKVQKGKMAKTWLSNQVLRPLLRT